MDKYTAIDKYEAKINDLEVKRKLILSTLADKDVAKHSKSVFKDVADIDIEIAIYIDVIETINFFEI